MGVDPCVWFIFGCGTLSALVGFITGVAMERIKNEVE